MFDKRILTFFAAFALFTITAGGAYYWPENKGGQGNLPAFSPASVPAEVAAAFSAEFAALHVADTAMALPDLPLTGPDGNPVRIKDFAGKPLLVNLWATWCAPCVVELPTLKRLAEHYEGRLQVIGIALEAGKSHQDILSFLDQRGLGDFAAFMDLDGRFAGALSVKGIPTSFLIGSNGLILYRFEGDANWTSAESKAFFDVFLLNQGPNR
jgi:thiol-disulfide isomerase/thioredoxin